MLMKKAIFCDGKVAFFVRLMDSVLLPYVWKKLFYLYDFAFRDISVKWYRSCFVFLCHKNFIDIDIMRMVGFFAWVMDTSISLLWCYFF